MLGDKVAEMILELRKGVGRERMQEIREIVIAKNLELDPVALKLLWGEKYVVSSEYSALSETGSELGISLSFADFGLGYKRTNRTQEGLAVRVDVVFSTENAPQVEKAELPKLNEFFKAIGYGEVTPVSA